MNDFEKEELGARVYRLSEVSNEELVSALARYRETAAGMWLLPEYCFDIGVVAGIGVAMFFGQFWVRLCGIVICLFCASHIAKRMGSFDGFRNGYEWGKQAGACRALGIPKGEYNGLLKKAGG